MKNFNVEDILSAENSNFDDTFGTDEKIVLYGCGAQAQELLEHCPKIEQILGVSDGKINQKEFMGYPFLNIHELKECQDSYKVAITSFKLFDEMKAQLLKNLGGGGEILPYINWQTRVHYNYSRSVYNQWVIHNMAALKEVHGLLEDDSSRSAFCHILVGLENISAVEWMYTTLLSQFNLVNYFDNGIYSLTEHEKFVDVGAYDGDTLLELRRVTHEQYDKIWAFEPDEELFSSLLENVEPLKDKRILCRKECVGKKSGTIGFSQNNNKFLSKPDPDCGEETEMIAIDDLDDDITFIKICIRGLENTLNVLEGAKQTCHRNRPKLAVVMALTDEGIVEIPRKIQEINRNYKIYFRLSVYPQASGQMIAACYFAV